MMVGSVVPLEHARRPRVTKDRILDAAESLFMEHGFEATSLRTITAAAAVNLASVNYHFGSKEELFQAVLARRLDPMNQERVDLLDRLEQEVGPVPLPCERILAAMFIPALRLARDPERGGKNFLRLLGRAYADPAPFIRRFLAEQYATMIARFKAAFARALPGLPRKELSWRLHFIMGALSYTLAGTDALRLIAELTPAETGNDEMLLQRLAPFLLAGLQSPVPDATDIPRGAEAGHRADLNDPAPPHDCPP
jgi:AcrR family transcriptional regulator